MARVRRARYVLMASLVASAVTTPARAADLKGRWYFGGNVALLSTTDDIRSNAAIAIGTLGDDGVPFTGDTNEDPCAGNSATTFCDPRPDELLSRETAIGDTFKYDVTAGFGLTSWLSLQLDASYFRGNVGPADAFLSDHFPVASNPLNTSILTAFTDRETVIPINAGEVTELPVSLSGIIRFRKDKPLNPYVGAGLGIIFSEIETDSDVATLNARIASMRIRGIASEFNEDLTPGIPLGLRAEGRIPFRHALELDVEDAFEWHLVGGVEYFMNQQVSLVFDARYTFADGAVTLDLGGEDQINVVIFSEKLFRSDGSVQIYAPDPVPPNPLCSENDYRGLGCDPVKRPAGQHVNPEGKNATGEAPFTCPAIGDFDRDGRLDQCYGPEVLPSPTGIDEPRGDVIIQGGKINLTGFAVAIGLRFHF